MFDSLQPCRLLPVACQASLSGSRVLQARILECIGEYCCHTLLEYYIFCFPSCQLPRVAGASRPLQSKQLHPLHTRPSQGQTQVPQGSLRSKTPVDDSHTEVKIQSQLKLRGSVAKEEDPKPSHHLYKLQVKSIRSTKQTLCLWNI